MAVQVDDGGGALLRSKIEALGVTVHTGANTKVIGAGETARHRLEFADGSALDTDVVVFSAGIRPRDELARASGLAVGERGGIVVDDACRTSDPNIFAIGECALWKGQHLRSRRAGLPDGAGRREPARRPRARPRSPAPT